jgi:hypothetical protein
MGKGNRFKNVSLSIGSRDDFYPRSFFKQSDCEKEAFGSGKADFRLFFNGFSNQPGFEKDPVI